MMSSVGSVIAGILLITLAGIFNGSWNAAFSPRANLAVGDNESRNDLKHHHAFALYSFYAGIINIPVCIYWAGGLERVRAIVEATPNISIILVVLFSVLWGFGTLLFGVACKVAGVGLGTNLSMGTIAILGTFLPLLTEKTLISSVGGVISAGLLVCCVGLWFATIALKKKDNDYTATLESDDISCDKAAARIGDTANADVVIDIDTNEKPTVEGKISDELHARNEEDSIVPQEEGYKVWQKIATCIICGLFAVQLQFAFIFGKPMVDLASGADTTVSLPGSTPKSGEAAIIWLFAFSLSTPISILYGIIASPVPISSAIKAPWWRHIRLILSTSIPWLSHIHLYGITTTILLPQRVAASIAWPLLMMITCGHALLLSIWLGEWNNVSKETVRTLKLSLSFTAVGLSILMCSAAIPVQE